MSGTVPTGTQQEEIRRQLRQKARERAGAAPKGSQGSGETPGQRASLGSASSDGTVDSALARRLGAALGSAVAEEAPVQDDRPPSGSSPAAPSGSSRAAPSGSSAAAPSGSGFAAAIGSSPAADPGRLTSPSPERTGTRGADRSPSRGSTTSSRRPRGSDRGDDRGTSSPRQDRGFRGRVELEMVEVSSSKSRTGSPSVSIGLTPGRGSDDGAPTVIVDLGSGSGRSHRWSRLAVRTSVEVDMEPRRSGQKRRSNRDDVEKGSVSSSGSPADLERGAASGSTSGAPRTVTISDDVDMVSPRTAARGSMAARVPLLSEAASQAASMGAAGAGKLRQSVEFVRGVLTVPFRMRPFSRPPVSTEGDPTEGSESSMLPMDSDERSRQSALDVLQGEIFSERDPVYQAEAREIAQTLAATTTVGSGGTGDRAVAREISQTKRVGRRPSDSGSEGGNGSNNKMAYCVSSRGSVCGDGDGSPAGSDSDRASNKTDSEGSESASVQRYTRKKSKSSRAKRGKARRVDSDGSGETQDVQQQVDRRKMFSMLCMIKVLLAVSLIGMTIFGGIWLLAKMDILERKQTPEVRDEVPQEGHEQKKKNKKKRQSKLRVRVSKEQERPKTQMHSGRSRQNTDLSPESFSTRSKSSFDGPKNMEEDKYSGNSGEDPLYEEHINGDQNGLQEEYGPEEDYGGENNMQEDFNGGQNHQQDYDGDGNGENQEEEDYNEDEDEETSQQEKDRKTKVEERLKEMEANIDEVGEQAFRNHEEVKRKQEKKARTEAWDRGTALLKNLPRREKMAKKAPSAPFDSPFSTPFSTQLTATEQAETNEQQKKRLMQKAWKSNREAMAAKNQAEEEAKAKNKAREAKIKESSDAHRERKNAENLAEQEKVKKAEDAIENAKKNARSKYRGNNTKDAAAMCASLKPNQLYAAWTTCKDKVDKQSLRTEAEKEARKIFKDNPRQSVQVTVMMNTKLRPLLQLLICLTKSDSLKVDEKDLNEEEKKVEKKFQEALNQVKMQPKMQPTPPNCRD